MTLEEAYLQCSRQAQDHYENFPVGSRLLPQPQRKYIHAVYAFARTADDFADETVQTLTVPERIELLERWENHLDLALEGKNQESIFIALREAIEKCQLPIQLFRDLISAFKQDIVKTRYTNFDEVLDYCRRSANPVGRLVLHVFNYRDETLHQLSDKICTGLQLANFWQDVSVDLLKDRIYLPKNDMDTFQIDETQLKNNADTPQFRNLLKFQVDRTWQIFNEGKRLPEYLTRGLRFEIRLTWLGGTEILRKIEKINYYTLHQRPTLSKWDILRLLPKACFKL
ncbi:MAG: squalene synthase HpnC [Verrucomicrobiae bacterium]|nr:squalene synthase HpnC [Verrucomicrobiae bacterium]